MKYAPSALLGPLSRSAGSTTASHNRFGNYLRNRVIPVNPNSSKQTTFRSQFGGWSSTWRTLTAAERTAWSAWANNISRLDSLGVAYTPTGLQAYVMANQNLFVIGASALTTPATFATPLPPTLGALTADASPQTLSQVYTGSIPGSDSWVFTATDQVSAGINFRPRSAYKFLQVESGLSTSPVDLKAAWTAIYGPLLAGNKIFLRAWAINSAGVASAVVDVSAIVSA